MLKTLALVAMASYAAAGPNADKDKVPYLPGMDEFSFGFYSGYLALPGTTTKALHYVFAESQNEPTTDPVIIWFNGGPGCSSMLGWAQEHGPYVMENGETTFHYNDYSWNLEASMLYIESPGGVGYSTCGSKAECTFDDDSSAVDNLNAILYFFETLFPEFVPNDLYISGESYAGIYVPYVVDQIDTYNKAAQASDTKLNLVGFMVGNGCTNWDFDTTPAYIEMGYWHGLYDDALYQTITDNQCESQFARWSSNITPQCFKALARFEALTNDVNVYDVYGICYQTGSASKKTDQFELYASQEIGMTKVGNEIKTYKKSASVRDYTPWLFKTEANEEKRLMELPPCTFGEPIIEYFNDGTVRNLLHIDQATSQAWDLCTSDITYNQQTLGSQWVYEKYKGQYKMLFYSGDTDGAVPTYGSLQWIADLGWDVTEAWRAYMVDGQVGGYLEAYDGGLTFGSVHGAGHMAPQFKRPQTYHLIFNWLQGKDI